MLAKNVNDNACFLIERGACEFFASKLAPTKRAYTKLGYQRPLITRSAGVSPTACQFGRYIDSTCGGGTR